MDSGMIGKILKAKQYAQERDRIEFTEFSVTFRGENNEHRVTYRDKKWHCGCNFFASHGVCSHTMALERVLADMVRSGQQPDPTVETATQSA